MSLLCSKQVGSSPSSRQALMDVSPVTPEPTTATLFDMVPTIQNDQDNSLRAGDPYSDPSFKSKGLQ